MGFLLLAMPWFFPVSIYIYIYRYYFLTCWFPPTKVTPFFLFPKIFYLKFVVIFLISKNILLFQKKNTQTSRKIRGRILFLPIRRFFQKKKLWADCRFLPFFTDFGGFSQYCWQFFFDAFKQYFSTFYPLFLTYPLPLVRYLEFDTS